MRLSKKALSTTLALVMGVSLCGIGASAWEDNTTNQEGFDLSVASIGNTRFDLPVSYLSDYSSSDKLRKESTNSYVSVTITSYRNTTNVPSRLRMRAYDITRKEKATIFHKVSGAKDYKFSYIITGNRGDYHCVDADVSADATAGVGAVSGYWFP